MTRYSNDIVDQYGAPVVGAKIYVYTQDEQLAPLTADGGGALANPVTSDQYGGFYFNTDDGLYTLAYYYAGKLILRDEAVMVGEGLPLPDSVITALGAPGGSNYLGFLQSGTGAVARTMQAKGRDSVSATDFGADPTGATDSTAAIVAAIATGRDVTFPDGTYKTGPFTASTPYQKLISLGKAVIEKNAAGTLLTISGRGVQVWGLYFEGKGATYTTSHNVEITAPDVRFFGVESRGAGNNGGRALKSSGSNAGNFKWFGGMAETLDVSGTGYDVEFDGVSNIYNALIGVNSSQNTGGVLIKGNGSDVNLTDCQFGKLRIEYTTGQSGGKFKGCRFTGVVNVIGTAFFDGNTFTSNVTIGDGSTAVSQVIWEASNVLQGGATFTLNAAVTQGSFSLGPLYSAGVTVTVNSTAARNNDIWHPRISYTPTPSASGGGFALGNGTLAGGYSREGRTILVDVLLQWGSTTTNGTGSYSFAAPLTANAAADGFGPGRVEASGSNYDLTAQVQAGTSIVYPNIAGNTMTATAPFAPTNGDRIKFVASYRV